MINRIEKYVFILTAILLYSCADKGNKSEDTLKPVKYGVVQLTGGLQEHQFNGVSKSSSETKLSFRSNGLILILKAKVGQRIRKGALLGQLDQKDALISYEKSKADLRNMEVQFETSKSQLERVKQLYQSENASLRDYELAKSNFSNAQSNLKAANRALALRKSQIEYTQIKAPMDGVISEVFVSVNEFARSGVPIVAMSSGKADTEIEIGVPENYISKVNNGQNVEATFNTNQDNVFTGVVTEVAYTTSGKSTYPVTIKILNPSKEIRPGMACKVTFKFGNVDDPGELVIPIKAVGDDPNGNFAFILDKENDYYIVRKTKIEIGELVMDGFVVKSGLTEGNLVAVAGLRSLYDGKRVSLLKN